MHGLETIRRYGVPALLVGGLLLALAACGIAGNDVAEGPTSVSHAAPLEPLHCQFHETPTTPAGGLGLGFGGGSLSCQVTGAASGETAFKLTYSVNGAMCRGSLLNGAGSCVARFVAYSFPLTSLGTVAGELLPDHRQLVPVIPLSVPPLVLRCAFHEMPSPPSFSVFNAEVSCQVTGAASGETAFKLTYSVNGATCRGSLLSGAGSCVASFTLSKSSTSLGTVAGVLLPDDHPLGPVAPFPVP